MAKKIKRIAGQGQMADAKAGVRLPSPRKPKARRDGHKEDADNAIGSLPPSSPDIANGNCQSADTDEATGRLHAVREPYAEETGHNNDADEASGGLPTPPRHSHDPRIQDIMALARERQYWMQMRLRNTARLAAEIRRYLQPDRGQEETWSESTKSEALKIVSVAVDREIRELRNLVRAAQRKRPLPNVLVSSDHRALSTASFVVRTARALADWQLEEERVLSEMERILSTLPIAPFCNDPERKGFTLAGLAVIIGHAGHPLDYPKKGHLWKRLGLAPYQKDGITRAGSSWARLGGLSKDDWTWFGYKRSRLGDLFGKITQPLLYAQWRSTGAIGPYGEAYGRYKARQKELNETGAFAAEAERQAMAAKKAGRKPQKALLEGKLPDSAINARALRYMTKRLIADLWFAWRRLDHVRVGEEPITTMSAAAEPIQECADQELNARAANCRLSHIPEPSQRRAGQIISANKATSDVPVAAGPSP